LFGGAIAFLEAWKGSISSIMHGDVFLLMGFLFTSPCRLSRAQDPFIGAQRGMRLNVAKRNRRPALLEGRAFLLAALLIFGFVAGASAMTPGIAAAVHADGSFAISVQDPPWTFGGSVGVPVNGLLQFGGRDGAGAYSETAFEYVVNGSARSSSIRVYAERPIVVFSTTLLSAGPNTALFPRVSTYPQGMYKFGFFSVYGHQYGLWGQGLNSPWAYFDSAGNTFIISPASHFPLAANIQDSQNALVAGINPAIQSLPAGFTQETMLAIGQGINHTWDLWGRAMTDRWGKARPSPQADVSLATLGYWTDSAAAYYYTFDPSKGYEGTLRAVKSDFAQHGIPLHYMQLDSWWYPKGNPPAWDNTGDTLDKGQYLMRPDRSILPHELSGLQKRLDDIPLITHARWIDPTSPLQQQYAMSGNVSTDRKYWRDLAAYLKAGGVMTYEQDWLASWAQPNMNAADPEVYLDEMARAMAHEGITMQYCGQDVGQVLQGAKYSNLTTARVSQDGFNPTRWEPFLYNSRLTSALGIFPFADNVYSSDVKSLLLATESAGMVGAADAIGTEVAGNLLQSIRPDGVIVKPDVPMVPMDSTYIADAQAQLVQGPAPPMVSFTFTDHSGAFNGPAGVKTFYVFAYSRAQDGSNATISVAPGELGMSGPMYAYNYFTQTGQLLAAGSPLSDSVASTGSYYIIAPVGPSGIALLGDTGKFNSASRQRIPVMNDSGVLVIAVQFAAGEAGTTIRGYSPNPPVVSAITGSIGPVSYDPVAGLFAVSVLPEPGDDNLATLTLSAY
jgi:hypothetical protein